MRRKCPSECAALLLSLCTPRSLLRLKCNQTSFQCMYSSPCGNIKFQLNQRNCFSRSNHIEHVFGGIRRQHGRQEDLQRRDFRFGVSVHFHRFHHLWKRWSKSKLCNLSWRTITSMSLCVSVLWWKQITLEKLRKSPTPSSPKFVTM